MDTNDIVVIAWEEGRQRWKRVVGYNGDEKNV